MLKYKQPNPLNIFGLRQVSNCPPHFTLVRYNLVTNQKVISDWIFENLEGRFWIGHHFITLDGNAAMENAVAFELASEASYFARILDQINSYNVI